MYHLLLSFPLPVVQNYAIHINFMHAVLANFKIVLNTKKLLAKFFPKSYLPNFSTPKQNGKKQNPQENTSIIPINLTLEYPQISFLR